MTHRIYDDHIILQQIPGGTWATTHGADFYIWEWDRWNGVNLEGLLRHLLSRGMIRPTVGIKHEVKHGKKWAKVDYIGFLTWIEKEQIAIIGQLCPDEKWGPLMAKVLEDKHYAEEHGELPLSNGT